MDLTSAVGAHLRRVSRAAALTTALGLCGCAGKTTGWAASTSKHVTVYTEALLEHEYIQEWLELSHAAYAAFFPGLDTGQVDVVWLKREPGSGTRVYGPLDDPHFGWTLENVPGGGRIGSEGLIVLERRDEFFYGENGFTAKSERDNGLAKEQMAHLFIMKALPNAPLWLQVGLGRYLAKFRLHYKADAWKVCFGGAVFDEPTENEPDPMVPLRGGAAMPGFNEGRVPRTGRRVVLPVEDVMTTDWYKYDRKLRYWYEYTSYALVHYLIQGEGGWHNQRFPIFLRALRAGQSTDEALATAYPHILPSEWDERLAKHVRPSRGAAFLAAVPTIPQGTCTSIPSPKHAEDKPSRKPVDPREIEVLLDGLERVDPFHRHAGWFPRDIVEAEAAKRPGKHAGPGGPAGGVPAGGAVPGADQPERDGTVPTLRTRAPAATGAVPAAAPPPPAPAKRTPAPPAPAAPPQPPAPPAPADD